MIKCLICNEEFRDFKCLSYHIRKHKITSKKYYDKYLKSENEGVCHMYGQIPSCLKYTKFNRLSNGYLIYCSHKCMIKSNKTKNKRNLTNLKKYGNVCSLRGVENKEKTKQTCIKKYGVDNPLKNKDIQIKVKKTIIKKYGVEYPYQINQNKFKNKVKNILNNSDLELLSEYNGYKKIIKVRCKKCNYIFETNYNNLNFNNCGRCPNCFPKNKSITENDIFNFIKSLNLYIIKNLKNIILPYELDVYIPSKNIAIEFDGLYWHSEQFIGDKNYHLMKTELSEKQNIQLIHIFEDEWIFKQDIVKSRLKQILGINNQQRIHARKCEIKEISPKVKNEFLNKFHLQGEDRSVIKLGAFYDNGLISVMTFSHGSLARNNISNKNIWELSRFCSNSNYHIPGIASKLLTYFKRNYNWKEIFSYADRRWSNGNVYKQIGFKLDSITKPNYWYIKGLNRIHRFNLRKRPDEPKDIPEWILRSKEGYYRIWDCGHYKFVMRN